MQGKRCGGTHSLQLGVRGTHILLGGGMGWTPTSLRHWGNIFFLLRPRCVGGTINSSLELIA